MRDRFAGFRVLSRALAGVLRSLANSDSLPSARKRVGRKASRLRATRFGAMLFLGPGTKPVLSVKA